MSISVNKINGRTDNIYIGGKETQEFQEMLYSLWMSSSLNPGFKDYESYKTMLELLLDGRKDD